MRLSGGRRYWQDYDALPDAACNVPPPGMHGKYGTLANSNIIKVYPMSRTTLGVQVQKPEVLW